MFRGKDVTFEHKIGELNQGIDEMFVLDGLLVLAVEPVLRNAVEVVHFFV